MKCSSLSCKLVKISWAYSGLNIGSVVSESMSLHSVVGLGSFSASCFNSGVDSDSATKATWKKVTIKDTNVKYAFMGVRSQSSPVILVTPVRLGLGLGGGGIFTGGFWPEGFDRGDLDQRDFYQGDLDRGDCNMPSH